MERDVPVANSERVLQPLSALSLALVELRMRDDDLLFDGYRDVVFVDAVERLKWWKLRKRLETIGKELTE